MLKTSNSPSLPPLKADEFLPPISRWTTIGGLVLIGGVGLAITLAAVLRYNIAVKAEATVRPSGELRLVQAGLAGTVERIEVKPNQLVQQGDIIARLDRAPLETQRQQLQGNIQQSQVQLSQMNAQIQLLDAQLAAESRSINQSVTVAQAELDRDQQQYTEQQITAQANLAEAEAALELANSELQRYQQLADTGAVAQLQLEEKLATVRSAEAQVARARAALNPSNAPVAIAQQRIAQTQTTGTATLANLNRERESLIQRRSEIQAQLIRDQQDLQRIELELEKSIVRATSDGIILQLNLRNPDQVVQSGDTVAEIAPSTNALLIKARVQTQDIDHVQLGQRTQLRITACPYPDYGTLSGKVTAIAPDAITPPANPNGTRYFEVTIQPDTLTLGTGDRQCQLQAGMDAEANIISRQETFLQFILRKARLLANV